MKSYRPRRVMLGIPGNINITSHPGKPSANRHTHQKFTTLNPLAIEADLLNPGEGALSRSQQLLDKAATANTVTPQKGSCLKTNTIKRFGQKIAASTGIRPSDPQSHKKMARYMGTVPEHSCSSKNKTLLPGVEAKSLKTSAQLNEAILDHLKQNDSLLKAEIEQRRIAEIDSALSHNTQFVKNNLSLLARRATNLANNAAKIKHQREIVSKLLLQHTAQACNATTILAELAKQIEITQTTIAHTTRKRDESHEAFCTLPKPVTPLENGEIFNNITIQTGIEHLKRRFPPETNIKFYSPTESTAGNIELNEAAFSLFAVSDTSKEFINHKQVQANKRSPLRPMTEQHYTLLVAKNRKEFHYFNSGEPSPQSIKATKELIIKLIKPHGLKFSDVEFIRHEAKHGKAPKQGFNNCERTVLSMMESLAFQEDLSRQISEQNTKLSQLQRSQNIQHRVVERFSQSAEKLENELRQLDKRQKQITQSAKVNADDIWKIDEELQKLQTLPKLTDVIAGIEIKHNRAKDAKKIATESLNTATEALNEHLLNTLPGFESGAASTKEAQILRAWVTSLGERAKEFGSKALSPTDAAAIGLQALSLATHGNIRIAAEVISTLKTVSWRQLVAQSGTTHNSCLPSGSAAAATAQLLANVPRGMQVLSHMLCRSDAPLQRTRIEAAQIYLRAGQHYDQTSLDDVDTRHLLANAQIGARYAVNGPSVDEGLAQATEEQRSAFHAVRNGYASKAPNSPYAQANAHLRMFAQWAQAGTTNRQTDGPNPLRSLREGMCAASAEALPTPQRRANEELRNAAKHLANYLSERRHARTNSGIGPSSVELAMRALSEHVQNLPYETDLTRLKLNPKAIRAIENRHAELEACFVNRTVDSERPEAAGHPGFAEVWKTLSSGRLTLLEAMDLLQKKMLAHPLVNAQSLGTGTAIDLEATERRRFLCAVGTVKRLLYDGDTDKVRSPQALFDFLRDFLQKLEWRDKLRITGQKVIGLNISPIFAASAIIPSGLGFSLILSGQKNSDRVLEIQMGRTGLYIQIGKQVARQAQIGASIGGGYVIPGTNQVPFGLGISANWRTKKESSIENGLQIRVPRRRKGNEIEERRQFLKMFEHLMHLISDTSAGPLEHRDLLGELLARHPSITVGLIADAPRKLRSNESSIMGTAGIRVGKVEGDPRRVSLGALAGFKARSENITTCTPLTGYMTMMMKDSLAQSRVDGEARAGASVMLKHFSENQDNSQKNQTIARLFASALGTSYTRELHSKGVNNFSTLWLFNNEIDPARTDCGFEFQTFSDFAQHVRENWDLWVNYGIPKVKGQVNDKLEYAVAERMLEDFMQKVHEHTRRNKFATILVDWSVKPELAPHLDALRAQALLLRLAGHNNKAMEMELAFDNLMASSEIFESTMLLVREKAKRQRERGIDFFGKYQNNRLAESMRTVGQWLPLDPIPQDPVN